jgi:major type 1 subunit fimbrin (pilin)
MKQRILAAAALVAIVGGFSFEAHAADGTITITGNLREGGCVVTPVARAVTTVNLPEISVAQLAGSGNVAATKAFAFELTGGTGCVEGDKVVMSFDGSPNADRTTGDLRNIAAADPATNVQIRLLDGKGTQIHMGTNPRAPEVTIDADDTARIDLAAQYIATGVATAGAVSTTVDYTLEYN